MILTLHRIQLPLGLALTTATEFDTFSESNALPRPDRALLQKMEPGDDGNSPDSQ